MTKADLLDSITHFSDFEAKYYLALWKDDHQASAGVAAGGQKIAPNQLFTATNAGDMSRLALLTIVAESPKGDAWLWTQMAEHPYKGEAKNFSKENTRDVSDVMMVLTATMAALGTDIKFSTGGGKIEFSLSFRAMSNPLIKNQFQKILAATAWFKAKSPEPVVAILTPIEVERQAVLAQLEKWTTVTSKTTHTNYSTSLFEGIHHRFKIINQLTGSGLIENAVAIERAMQEFKPDLVLMVGVAGGIKDVSKGDLVVGERAYGYERGKQTAESLSARPQVYHYSHRLVQESRKVVDLNVWQSRIAVQENFPHTASPRIFFGPIASGNKVLVSSDADLAHFLKSHYNDTLAIEMEAIGFQALLQYERIMALNIRGISDLLDDKAHADQQNHQPLAAARAAAFAFELLHQLDLTDLIK